MEKLADGTYVQTRTGVQDASTLFQGRGYIVAVRPFVEGDALEIGDLIGSWTDTETGKVYLDHVEHYWDERIALNLAAVRGEIAIWDVANSKEIRL